MCKKDVPMRRQTNLEFMTVVFVVNDRAYLATGILEPEHVQSSPSYTP